MAWSMPEDCVLGIFGKKPEYIFTEFEGTYKTDLSLGEGDVKYHMGYSADFKTRKGKSVHLSLANNPSVFPITRCSVWLRTSPLTPSPLT